MARDSTPAKIPAPSKTEQRKPLSDLPEPERKPAKPAPDFVFDDWASI